MTVNTFDPAGWIARAEAIGRTMQVVGSVVYFGRAQPENKAADAALFDELRAAGGVGALKPYLSHRGERLARIAATLGRAA